MRKFTLKLNPAKNTDYNEKCFKQKLPRIKFSTKILVDKYFYLSKEWSNGAPKIYVFEIL